MEFIDKLSSFLINSKDKENLETMRKGKFFVASILLFISLGIPYNLYSFIFQSNLVVENFITIIFLGILVLVLVLYKKFQIRVLLVNLFTCLLFLQLYQTYLNGGIYSTDNLWCIVFSCWVFLVANKRSGLAWFSISILYYSFLFYAEQNKFKDFKHELFNNQIELVYTNLIAGAIFMCIIVYLHEKGKEKFLKDLKVAKANIEAKSMELEIQKKDIISSINYASRIQSAVLPPVDLIQRYIPASFILYKPKQIVSGDFYFIKQTDELLFIAAADCTGHGVPGSLMTILGLTFLNELINSNQLKESNKIIDALRDKIKIALKQTGKANESKDGMDIALCVIDKEKHTMQFSGANNSLIQIRNGALIVHKADKMPIGIYPKEHPFEKIDINIEANDQFYLYSDGFVDQFGGAKSEKFKSKNFKEILLNIHTLAMPEQKDKLEAKHTNWQGLNEQTDDILIIGFKYEFEK